jgi:hypothetical protein
MVKFTIFLEFLKMCVKTQKNHFSNLGAAPKFFLAQNLFIIVQFLVLNIF